MNEKTVRDAARSIIDMMHTRRAREGLKSWSPKQRHKGTDFIIELLKSVDNNGNIAASIGKLESAAKMSNAHEVAMFIMAELEAMEYITPHPALPANSDSPYKDFMQYIGQAITRKFAAFLYSQSHARQRRE